MSDFNKLWIGQSISEFGSHITRDALPLVAVITLAASPEQLGLLVTIQSVPILLLGLFAGVNVDRIFDRWDRATRGVIGRWTSELDRRATHLMDRRMGDHRRFFMGDPVSATAKYPPTHPS